MWRDIAKALDAGCVLMRAQAGAIAAMIDTTSDARYPKTAAHSLVAPDAPRCGSQ